MFSPGSLSKPFNPDQSTKWEDLKELESKSNMTIVTAIKLYNMGIVRPMSDENIDDDTGDDDVDDIDDEEEDDDTDDDIGDDDDDGDDDSSDDDEGDNDGDGGDDDSGGGDDVSDEEGDDTNDDIGDDTTCVRLNTAELSAIDSANKNRNKQEKRKLANGYSSFFIYIFIT